MSLVPGLIWAVKGLEYVDGSSGLRVRVFGLGCAKCRVSSSG